MKRRKEGWTSRRTRDRCKTRTRGSEQGDFEGFVNSLGREIEWHLPAMEHVPFAGTWQGREGVREFLRQLIESQEVVEFKPEQFIAQGNKVIVLGRFVMRVKSTGRESASLWAHVWTITAGQITHYRDMLRHGSGQRRASRFALVLETNRAVVLAGLADEYGMRKFRTMTSPIRHPDRPGEAALVSSGGRRSVSADRLLDPETRSRRRLRSPCLRAARPAAWARRSRQRCGACARSRPDDSPPYGRRDDDGCSTVDAPVVPAPRIELVALFLPL